MMGVGSQNVNVTSATNKIHNPAPSGGVRNEEYTKSHT